MKKIIFIFLQVSFQPVSHVTTEIQWIKVKCCRGSSVTVKLIWKKKKKENLVLMLALFIQLAHRLFIPEVHLILGGTRGKQIHDTAWPEAFLSFGQRTLHFLTVFMKNIHYALCLLERRSINSKVFLRFLKDSKRRRNKC